LTCFCIDYTYTRLALLLLSSTGAKTSTNIIVCPNAKTKRDPKHSVIKITHATYCKSLVTK